MVKTKMLNGREFRVIWQTTPIPEAPVDTWPAGYVPQVKKYFWNFSWWSAVSSYCFDTKKEAWDEIDSKSITQREFRVIPRWLPVAGAASDQKVYVPQVKKHFLFFSWWSDFYPTNVSQFVKTPEQAWNVIDLKIIEEQMQEAARQRDREMFTTVVKK